VGSGSLLRRVTPSSMRHDRGIARPGSPPDLHLGGRAGGTVDVDREAAAPWRRNHPPLATQTPGEGDVAGHEEVPVVVRPDVPSMGVAAAAGSATRARLEAKTTDAILIERQVLLIGWALR
jgi:hypothetical protein